MPKNKRPSRYISMPPYSREAEYKYIFKILKQTQEEVKDFRDYYLDGVKLDSAACVKCLDSLLQDWECDRSEIRTWRDYINILKSKAVDRKLKESDAFTDLRFLCERICHFEGYYEDQVNKLMDCAYEHVYRYCVSFELETKGIEIKSVREYEETISQNRKFIDQTFDEIADNMRQVDKLTRSFYDYVSSEKEHRAVMEKLCQNIFDICKTVKAWIKEDRGYADRIWQEMQTYMNNREHLKQEKNNVTKKRDELTKRIEQIEKQKQFVIKNYERHKREKIKLRRRIEVVEFKIERLKTSCDQKEVAYKQIQEYKSIDNPLTPRKQISYDRQLEGLLRDIEEMDLQVEPTEKHLEDLKKKLKEETNTAYELKVEAATLDNDQHDLRKEYPDLDVQIESADEGFQENDRKIKIMEKIRRHTALAETLRKLHRNEELEKPAPENNDLLEAMEEISKSLGKEWRSVYLKLPFMPHREKEKKQHDIQILSMVAMRCDLTHEEEAMKSFEKWLTFSRRGNLKQLVRTLRKVQRVDLASYLEEKYMLDNVY